MSNPLEQLEEDASARKRTGRQPGGSRNPRRKPASEDDVKAKAAAELAAREKEAERRRAEREAEEKAAARKGPTVDEPEGSQEPPAPPPDPGPPPSKRPKSMPFYPNPEDEDFLWQVQEAATARREKIPATAILRFALRRLSDQMTPSEIVRALSGPVQTRGKTGRPRR
ncbi:hypothetical protein ABZ508_34230 [Streptomyces lavendulocolor]|uniref:Uncharacterized protein n=1 Tax=Streptomyces lavendulocolor TaxID=67316 RepID=A0ABV2WGE1_9ACTN